MSRRPIRWSMIGGALLAAVLTAAAPAAPSTAAPAAPAAPAAQPAPPDQQVLFNAADQPGYACFRIPATVRARNGDVLAFAEGRKHDCGDAGPIDVVLRRSTDGGRTWGPLQVVNRGGDDTHGNPVPIVDRRTGRIVLITTDNAGRLDGKSCDTPCDRTPHLQTSSDNGATWSAPRDLTGEARRADWNSWLATGPGHGIQLTRGPHAGRLVFGLNAETWNGSRITANHAALIHSDDGGEHWTIGAVDSWPISAADGTFRQKPSELSVEQRADGDLYVSGREQDGTDLGHRDYAVSHDGGDTFEAPFRDIPDLYAPMVQGVILPYRTAAPGHSGTRRVLMSVPADPDRRRTMAVRTSWDDGRTWEAADHAHVVTTDWSGYSDLVPLDGGAVGLLYEGGTVASTDEIRFARLGADWLNSGEPAHDPRTPDLAPGARAGHVLGSPAPADGGMHFTGSGSSGDGVRLPFNPRQPLGTDDFTARIRFRYRAADGEQPMLWMGGVGSTQPQVWVRGEPASGRIRALITVRDGAANPVSGTVSTAGAYNDGRWHTLELRRAGGTLTLTVDGRAATAPDPDPHGSVSRNSPFGIHLGMRMDGLEHYTGDLADFRLTRGEGDPVSLVPLRRTR